MKQIKRTAKVLSISHNDLDGVGAQILLGHVFKNIEYIECSYYNIDKTLISINPEDYDVVFITDISPKIIEILDRFDNAILIDHHQNAVNNPKKHIYVNYKYSGTYLTNHFLEKMYGEELMSPYKKMVKLVNDYDMWILKYKGSKILNDLYGMYNHTKFRLRFSSGKLSLNKNEQLYIADVEKRFNELYDNIVVEEFDTINACWFESDIFVNELAQKLMEEEGYMCVMFNTMKTYNVSIRSVIDDFNFGTFLQDLNIGGGHKKSAGVVATSIEDMNNKVNMIEKHLYDKIEMIRK